jgi:prepilin-type N-terminal cleavage/methylation domain-containing protein
MKLKQGFSLIELLVVVAIIGILAAIGTVGYNNYISNAQGAASTANAKQIADALAVEDSKANVCTTNVLSDCFNSLTGAANIPVCDPTKLGTKDYSVSNGAIAFIAISAGTPAIGSPGTQGYVAAVPANTNNIISACGKGTDVTLIPLSRLQ